VLLSGSRTSKYETRTTLPVAAERAVEDREAVQAAVLSKF
jgi:hypothetical protein